MSKDAEPFFSAIESITRSANRSGSLQAFLDETVSALVADSRIHQVVLGLELSDGIPLKAVGGEPLTQAQSHWIDRRIEALSLGETALIGLDGTGGCDSMFGGGSQRVMLAPLPCGERARGLLLLVFRGTSPIHGHYLQFLRSVANIVGAAVVCPRRQDWRKDRIERAKQEWEATVDALPQVICLLDRTGRILRANRTLETWGLGKIGTVLGKEGGCVLRSRCTESRCNHLAPYEAFWREPERDTLTWETSCRRLGRSLRSSMRRLAADDPRQEAAVLVIEDITEQRTLARFLETNRRELGRQVAERTEQLREANARLELEVRSRHWDKETRSTAERERRALTRRLVEAEDRERRRIARELHDGLGQSLSAVKLSLEMFSAQRRPGGVAERKQLQAILQRVGAAIEETRRIAVDLRPAMLDDLGIAPTLVWLCREFQNLHGIETRLQLDLGRVAVEGDLAAAVYRICQEALHNVAKHARASQVRVAFSVVGGNIVLRISDNGEGLPSRPADRSGTAGYGLENMCERVELTGGRFEVESKAGAGVTIHSSWPVEAGRDVFRRRTFGWGQGKPESHCHGTRED